MYELIFNKLEQDVVKEIESRIPLIIEDSEGELTYTEAGERACEAILNQADEMGMFYLFEYVIKKSGYYPYQIRNDNPYLACEPKPKVEVKYDLAEAMGLPDIPSFFKN